MRPSVVNSIFHLAWAVNLSSIRGGNVHVEHRRLNLPHSLDLQEKPVVAGLGKSVGERYLGWNALGVVHILHWTGCCITRLTKESKRGHGYRARWVNVSKDAQVPP